MSYQASISDIEKNYLDPSKPSVVGNGQCVAFVVKVATKLTTSHWKKGKLVAGDVGIPAGTAIATFDPNGQYGNHLDGRSHAAIYVSQNPDSLTVYDQWVGQPVHKRAIRMKHAKGAKVSAVNDGTQYHVIE